MLVVKFFFFWFIIRRIALDKTMKKKYIALYYLKYIKGHYYIFCLTNLKKPIHQLKHFKVDGAFLAWNHKFFITIRFKVHHNSNVPFQFFWQIWKFGLWYMEILVASSWSVVWHFRNICFLCSSFNTSKSLPMPLGFDSESKTTPWIYVAIKSPYETASSINFLPSMISWF